ncbi:hypothetical protein BDN67DRAFT_133597 [Paxillus ammoniavirescens]|nr:hypothetical protein BDN67DRAFT_133597 [Paxillus ammoniavirescens]
MYLMHPYLEGSRFRALPTHSNDGLFERAVGLAAGGHMYIVVQLTSRRRDWRWLTCCLSAQRIYADTQSPRVSTGPCVFIDVRRREGHRLHVHIIAPETWERMPLYSYDSPYVMPRRTRNTRIDRVVGMKDSQTARRTDAGVSNPLAFWTFLDLLPSY